MRGPMNISSEMPEGQQLSLAEETLIYPHPHHDTSGGDIPTILWSLLLLFGILAILARGPREAPAFDTLTAFTCDPLPVLSYRWSWIRSRQSPALSVTHTCRAGTRVIYQRGPPPIGMNYGAGQSCLRAGGTIKIWRHAPPSPYGRYVFQASCNGEIYADYKTRAANYVLIHATGMLVAAGLVILSLIGLAARLHLLRHHRTTAQLAG
jgi:hypothetical protein